MEQRCCINGLGQIAIYTEPEAAFLVLDGFGAIRKIRADPAFAGLPVLAATAYAMRGDREKTLEAGFDGYVSKPIQPAALKQEIARLLSMQAGKAASAKAAGAATG